MRIVQYLVFAILVTFHQFSFAAACPTSSDTTTAGNGNCTITGSASTIQLNFNSGFDSSTSITAIDGNNGTTVGAQRKLSFIKAAEVISEQVTSTVTLVVDASFSALTCTSNSAILGSAGASTNLGVSSGAPSGILLNTFYPIGLYNAITGSDANSGVNDIAASFNANIGTSGCLQSSNGWYYGFSSPASNYIGFTTVLLHEMTHGLGFASLVNPSTGAKAGGIDDIFSNNLYDKANGRNWNNGSESNANRATSATSVTGLLWSGTNTNAQAIGLLTNGFDDVDSDGNFESGDKVEMYAPSSVESGSSVSHFSTDATPNELMEPSYTDGLYSLSLALYLLKDIGWGIVTNTAPTITAVDQSTNEDVTKVVDASGWGSDADNDTLTYTVASSCATNITCSINTNGTSLTMIPAANHNGGTHTITINLSDGNGGTASDTFNLNIAAQNDAPTWSAIPNQNITVGSNSVINLNTYASDVEGDSLSYSATACGANLTCAISSNTLTVTANAGAATTVIVTIEADDSNGGTNSDSFDVTINSPANNAPTLTAVDQSTNEDTDLVVDISSWGSDADSDSLTYSVTTCASNITCSISGTNLTLSPSANHNGAIHTITLQVSDGNGGATSDSFNLNVVAQNDAPTTTAVNQTTNEDTAIVVDISTWGNDVDGDALTYSVTTCASNITCTLVGTSLTLTPDSNHNGATHTITIKVDDGIGGSASDSFNLNLAAVNDVPVFNVLGNQTLMAGANVAINLNDFSSDVDGDALVYSATVCGAHLTCTINASTLTVTAGTGFIGSEGVSVQVDDQNGGTSVQSFTVTITASSNTTPTLSISDQSTLEDNALVMDLSGFAADADGDSLGFAITACATNISCSLVGSALTLTPDNDHNGASHTISIEINDNNGGTISDSFNLTVTQVNDAPSWQVIGNISLEINESQNIQLTDFASDVEGDALTFSTTCHGNLTCSFVGTTLSIGATGGAGETVSINIQADDGNGGTTSTSLNITITSNIPSTHVDVGDTLFNHGDSLTLNLDDGQIDVLGGSGNYSYDLEFGGENVSQLVTSNSSGINIGLPDSGAFAGTYTLTITDNSNGEVITLSVERPLRLNFSSAGLLNSDASQTLKIEGGAVGSQYQVEELNGGHLIFSDTSGQEQSTYIATNNAGSFNAATVQLASNTVSQITQLEIRVTSLDANYGDVTRETNLYPAIEHHFTVTDTFGNAIPQASANLVENARLTELNVELTFTADVNGQFSIWLPDDDQFYGLNIASNGYHSSDLTLSASLTEHHVTLTLMSNAITLSGSINALGTQDFSRNNPTMSLHFSDGSSETIIVTVSNTSQASFNHEVDLNTQNINTMRIEQVDSLNIEIDMSQIAQNQNYNILLERTVAIVVSAPAPKESSGSGAIDIRYLMLLLLLGLVRRRKTKTRYQQY